MGTSEYCDLRAEDYICIFAVLEDPASLCDSKVCRKALYQSRYLHSGLFRLPHRQCPDFYNPQPRLATGRTNRDLWEVVSKNHQLRSIMLWVRRSVLDRRAEGLRKMAYREPVSHSVCGLRMVFPSRHTQVPSDFRAALGRFNPDRSSLSFSRGIHDGLLVLPKALDETPLVWLDDPEIRRDVGDNLHAGLLQLVLFWTLECELLYDNSLGSNQT